MWWLAVVGIVVYYYREIIWNPQNIIFIFFDKSTDAYTYSRLCYNRLLTKLVNINSTPKNLVIKDKPKTKPKIHIKEVIAVTRGAITYLLSSLDIEDISNNDELELPEDEMTANDTNIENRLEIRYSYGDYKYNFMYSILLFNHYK